MDNDPDLSARGLRSHKALLTGDLVSVAGGMASMRNAALDWAGQQGMTHVAFLDDDMRPETQWLTSLLAVSESYGADLVVGAIHQPADVQSLPHARAMLTRLQGRDEGLLDVDVTSGNLLVSMDFVQRSGVRFDESLDSSGAEDTWFGRQARRRGAIVAYAPRAVVTEMNDASAVTPLRLFQRSLANGRALTALDDLAGVRPSRAILMAKTAGAGAVAILGAPTVLVGSDPATAWRRVFAVARNLGRVLGPSSRSGRYRGLGRPETSGR